LQQILGNPHGGHERVTIEKVNGTVGVLPAGSSQNHEKPLWQQESTPDKGFMPLHVTQ
jgi:hypothetical protein